jgi:hypothetical protein
MGTSIRDLIDTLGTELGRPAESAAQAGRDAARLLEIAGRMLNHLADQGLDPTGERSRGEAVRSLAALCERASATFVRGRGRCSDLLGATSDLVSIRRDELNRSDRAYITIAVGEAVRLAARRIAESGPYEKTSAIAEVRYCATQVALAYAARAPVAERIGALDRPLPRGSIPIECTAGQTLLDSMSTIVDTLKQRWPLASAREMSGIASAMEALQGECNRRDVKVVSSVDWVELQRIANMVIDGESRQRANLAPLMGAVTHVHMALRETIDANEIEIAATMVQSVAVVAAVHVERSVGQWIVPVGERQLSEDRVAEWLRRETLILNRLDVRQALSRRSGH